LHYAAQPAAWKALSYNSSVRHRHVLANDTLPWPLCVRARFADFKLPQDVSPDDLVAISRACHPTVMQRDGHRLDFGELSHNMRLSIDVLLRFPDRDWLWTEITGQALKGHRRLQPEQVLAHLAELPWDLAQVRQYEGSRCARHGYIDLSSDDEDSDEAGM
jgi:hypothetical protein